MAKPSERDAMGKPLGHAEAGRQSIKPGNSEQERVKRKMRIVAQRVKEAKVEVEGRVVGRIGQGLLLLVGIRKGDTPEAVEELARKVAHLRIFEDESGRMNRSVLEVGGGILSVSQFTLYGDCAKGRRPNFMSAAGAEEARPLYEALNARLAEYGVEVATGEFGAKMEVALTNDGPVTLILESAG